MNTNRRHMMTHTSTLVMASNETASGHIDMPDGDAISRMIDPGVYIGLGSRGGHIGG